MTPQQQQALRRSGYSPAHIAQTQQWLAQPQHQLLCVDDPLYPPMLREIPAPPAVLFGNGDTNQLLQPSIAIVGSRHGTAVGLRHARDFAAHLSALGYVVVSGMAIGVDGSAHHGALSTGTTVAVLGCGIDIIYPKCHTTLYQRIAEKGCIISEFPLGTPPLPWRFPKRNRIITGMCVAVIIVEAAVKSGSLTSARAALEQNRDVFVLPGSIDNVYAQGCNQLIRDGAVLVESPAEVHEFIAPIVRTHALLLNATIAAPLTIPKQIPKPIPKPIPKQPATPCAVLSAIGDAPISFAELLQHTGYEVIALQEKLFELEVSGVIQTTARGIQRR